VPERSQSFATIIGSRILLTRHAICRATLDLNVCLFHFSQTLNIQSPIIASVQMPESTQLVHAKPLKRPSVLSFGFFLVLATGIWFLCTILYGFAVSSPTNTMGNYVSSIASPTTVYRTLGILSKGMTILLGALVLYTLDAVMWTAASSKGGVTMPTFLALSPATDTTGLLELVCKWFHWKKRPQLSGCLRLLAPSLR